jgi:hypothetical protein
MCRKSSHGPGTSACAGRANDQATSAASGAKCALLRGESHARDMITS